MGKSNGVRETFASIVREEYLFQQKVAKESLEIKRYIAELRDSYDFFSWKKCQEENDRQKIIKKRETIYKAIAQNPKKMKYEQQKLLTRKLKSARETRQKSKKDQVKHGKYMRQLEIKNRERNQRAKNNNKEKMFKVKDRLMNFRRNTVREMKTEAKVQQQRRLQQRREHQKEKAVQVKLQKVTNSKNLSKITNHTKTFGHGLLLEKSEFEVKARLALKKKKDEQRKLLKQTSVRTKLKSRKELRAQKYANVLKARRARRQARLG